MPPAWPWPPLAPGDRPGDGDILVVALDLESGDEAAARALLDPGELARADRLRAPLHRARFARAHAGLRRVLAACTGIPAGHLGFAIGTHGKPRLSGPGPGFSLSHGGGRGLVAVAWLAAVGVDIEAHDRAVDGDGLARRWFSAGDAEALAALPPELRLAGFFARWTRSEATVKALGLGLATSLAAISTGSDPRLPGPHRPGGLAAALAVVDLPVGAGWSAALAAPAGDWRPRLRRLAD